MTRFSWYSYEAQVDLEASRDYYEKAGEWDCSCGHCRNFLALARGRKLPEELLAILDSLSIPPEKATYVCELYYDKDCHETYPVEPEFPQPNFDLDVSLYLPWVLDEPVDGPNSPETKET